MIGTFIIVVLTFLINSINLWPISNIFQENCGLDN